MAWILPTPGATHHGCGGEMKCEALTEATLVVVRAVLGACHALVLRQWYCLIAVPSTLLGTACSCPLHL
jgi:hypothetical protein